MGAGRMRRYGDQVRPADGDEERAAAAPVVVLVAIVGDWVHRIAAIRGLAVAKVVNLSRCKSTTYRSYPKIMHIFFAQGIADVGNSITFESWKRTKHNRCAARL
jgi:hypothetical protein